MWGRSPAMRRFDIDFMTATQRGVKAYVQTLADSRLSVSNLDQGADAQTRFEGSLRYVAQSAADLYEGVRKVLDETGRSASPPPDDGGPTTTSAISGESLQGSVNKS